MFRIPWWVKTWIRQNININPKTAEQKKLYLAIVYAVTSFGMFNYYVYTSKTPGLTDEEEKIMTPGEKVLFQMNAPRTEVIKYKLGYGVVSQESVNREDFKASVEQRLKDSHTVKDEEEFSDMRY